MNKDEIKYCSYCHEGYDQFDIDYGRCEILFKCSVCEKDCCVNCASEEYGRGDRHEACI